MLFVLPRDAELRLPTDLLGLTPLTYRTGRSDGNLVAALGPACNSVRRTVGALGKRAKFTSTSETVAESADRRDLVEDGDARLRRLILQWNGPELAEARKALRSGIPLHPIEDESGEATAAMERVFAFLESVADAVVNGSLPEAGARTVFEVPIREVWRTAFTFLASLNGAEEWWDPLSRIAELDRRWSVG